MTQILVQPITDKTDWENYAATHSDSNFLQSYNWGLFNNQLKKFFFALAILVNGKQQGAALVVKEPAKRGNYFTIAGGPLIDWSSPLALQIFQELIKYLRKLAQNEKCHFVRIRPQVEDSPQIRKIFSQSGLILAPMHLTADLTLRLDLTLSNDELLKQMRKNTRYEIKKGLKLGISTKITSDPDFIDQFYDHQLYLAKKHNFVPFDYQFLRLQFETFATDHQAVFVNSYFKDQLLASAFIIFYQQEAVYHYGVSTDQNSKLPGSYVTQWQAIQEARKRGCKIYNFWGIAPLDKPKHRFAGVSLFKRGFGGHEVQHLPAHDLPTSKYYQVIKLFELMRKKARKL